MSSQARHSCANRHMREAAEFSSRMGGLDNTVKTCFYKLSAEKRRAVFDLYGERYGAGAKTYAQKAWQLWKTNRRTMSGMVAKRLFDCVPPFMSEREKYSLAEKLWQRDAPASVQKISVGPSAPLSAVLNVVTDRLDAVVTDHFIPPSLSEHFRWLTENDVLAYEQLLNFFVRQEKELARQELSAILPSLQQQKREHPELTHDVKKTIRAGKHSIELRIEGAPDSREVREWRAAKTHEATRLGWFIAAAAAVGFLLAR